MALSFNKLCDNSSQMSHKNIYEQYLIINPPSQLSSMLQYGASTQYKYMAENETRGAGIVRERSVLESLLSAPPPKAPHPPRRVDPSTRECLVEADTEWTNAVHVPFDAHCRIKWNWTSAKENESHVMVSNHCQLGTQAIVFQPQSQSRKFACFETFAAMGDRPLRKNAFTYWQVEISTQTLNNATSIMVGLGSKQAKQRSVGYMNLIGADQHSWGLSNKGQLWHNNQNTAYCKPLGSSDQESAIIGLLYDGFTGQLSFYVNGTNAGPAFTGLGHHELYPMISSTASNSSFKMGPVHESMPTLQDLCRNTVLTSLSPSSWNQQILPKSIIHFLK